MDEKQKCIDLLIRDSQFYSSTLQIVSFVHKFLKENNLEWTLIQAEDDVKTKEGKSFEVDIVIAKNENLCLIEIKNSLPNKEEEIYEDIKNNRLRLSDVFISGKKYKTNNFIFICHVDKIQNLVEMYEKNKDLSGEGESKKICFVSFNVYKNTGNEETLKLQFYKGNADENEFLSKLKENPTGITISLPKIAIYQTTKNFTFSKRKPPIPYLAGEIEGFIRQFFSKVLQQPNPRKEQRVNFDDFYSFILERTNNEFSKLKRDWVIEGLVFLRKMNTLRFDGVYITVSLSDLAKPKKQNKQYEKFSRKICTERMALERRKPTKKRKIRKSASSSTNLLKWMHKSQ